MLDLVHLVKNHRLKNILITLDEYLNTEISREHNVAIVLLQIFDKIPKTHKYHDIILRTVIAHLESRDEFIDTYQNLGVVSDREKFATLISFIKKQSRLAGLVMVCSGIQSEVGDMDHCGFCRQLITNKETLLKTFGTGNDIYVMLNELFTESIIGIQRVLKKSDGMWTKLEIRKIQFMISEWIQ